MIRKRRHNTDWLGCSSFDSGSRFHGRFPVPFAWLIEAYLSRNTSQPFHGTSELHREDDERLVRCTLLICSSWFKCEEKLKAAVFELWFFTMNLKRCFPWHCEMWLSSSSRGFLPVLRMAFGTSRPHCSRCLGSTVVHTLLFHLLSYRLDKPANYSQFSAHGFYSWREKGGDVGVSSLLLSSW